MEPKLCILCSHKVMPEEFRVRNYDTNRTELCYRVMCRHCGTVITSPREELLELFADVPELKSETAAPKYPLYNAGNGIFYTTLNDRNSGDNFGNV